MFYAFLAAIVFSLAVVVDYSAVKYNQAIKKKRRHSAARWGVLVGICALVGFASILDVSYWYAVPELMGSYVGIYIGVGESDGQSSN